MISICHTHRHKCHFPTITRIDLKIAQMIRIKLKFEIKSKSFDSHSILVDSTVCQLPVAVVFDSVTIEHFLNFEPRLGLSFFLSSFFSFLSILFHSHLPLLKHSIKLIGRPLLDSLQLTCLIS